MRWLLRAAVLGLSLGCAERTPPPPDPDAGSELPADLSLVFVHGVEACEESRRNAHQALDELEAALSEALPARLQEFSSQRQITFRTARVNLYTAASSGTQPSDSADPLKMDDWEAGDPGCSAARQGEPCTTAYEWRYRLAGELRRRLPEGSRNVVLIGHSTGGRVAMEVAANAGPGGVGSMDWGLQDRIAGVVTLHGMIDALGSSRYDVAGPASFLTTCKASDFAGGCANGNGWCEYASEVDGAPAAEWVARNKRALMLISWASCSPALWTGYSDGLLPYDAQGTASARGVAMTPAPGETWRPAHGVTYGAYCHSAPVKQSLASNEESVTDARAQILEWLFDQAPQPAQAGTAQTDSPLGYQGVTPPYSLPPSCSASAAETLIEIAGVCHHPGFFDGDDHPIAPAELAISEGPDCGGSFTWSQQHDPDNPHAASFWWKAHQRRAGLLHALTF